MLIHGFCAIFCLSMSYKPLSYLRRAYPKVNVKKAPPAQSEPVAFYYFLMVSEFWLYALATHFHSPCIFISSR